MNRLTKLELLEAEKYIEILSKNFKTKLLPRMVRLLTRLEKQMNDDNLSPNNHVLDYIRREYGRK